MERETLMNIVNQINNLKNEANENFSNEINIIAQTASYEVSHYQRDLCARLYEKNILYNKILENIGYVLDINENNI